MFFQVRKPFPEEEEMKFDYNGHGDLDSLVEADEAPADAALPAPSALPWRLCPEMPCTVLSGRDAEAVADCDRMDERQARANAAFVVLACNSHHALVRAARAALASTTRAAVALLLGEALAQAEPGR
jgi:hypothetical protein